MLSEASEANTRAWISYVDHNGKAAERIVEPVRVADGWLTAYDEGADQPRLRPIGLTLSGGGIRSATFNHTSRSKASLTILLRRSLGRDGSLPRISWTSMSSSASKIAPKTYSSG